MFLSDGFWLNKLVGGWQINAIGMYQSGFPLTFTQSSNNSGSFSAGQRPNLIPGIAVETEGSVSDRVDNYLNPAAFSAASPFTFGNVGRTINARSPGQQNWDIGFSGAGLTDRFRTQMLPRRSTPSHAASRPTLRRERQLGRVTSSNLRADSNQPALVLVGGMFSAPRVKGLNDARANYVACQVPFCCGSAARWRNGAPSGSRPLAIRGHAPLRGVAPKQRATLSLG